MLAEFAFDSSHSLSPGQLERATSVVEAIREPEGEHAAATFAIGLHNGFAHKLYGPLTDDIADALRETQAGRACLSLGIQLYQRKRTEAALYEAQQEIRDLRRAVPPPPRGGRPATYMTWPVVTEVVRPDQALIRELSRNTLKIVPLESLDFVPEKRGQPRPT